VQAREEQRVAFIQTSRPLALAAPPTDPAAAGPGAPAVELEEPPSFEDLPPTPAPAPAPSPAPTAGAPTTLISNKQTVPIMTTACGQAPHSQALSDQ